MAITISDISPRIQYTATAGQTSFTVPFEFFDDDDLVVVNTNSGGVDTTLTKAASPSTVTQYSVTGAGVTGGGSITLGAGATLNDTYTITRNVPIARSTDFATTGVFPIDSLNTELDKIVAMMQQQGVDINLSPRAASTTSTAYGLIFPELTANKVLSVNSNGDGLIFTQEIGNYKGNWAASTAYVQRDLVKDTSNGNIYIVNTAHTSSGSQPLSTNTNSSYYDLIVDAETASTYASNAATSATAAASSATSAATSATAAQTAQTAAELAETNAETAQTAAETAQTGAETAETNAGTSATAAASSATSASTQATNAATSATAAATSATNASTSESNAASSATSAAGSATTATTQASAASTSATNAATSETNAATSASNASTSETNAANSATSAATSATNASTSSTNAANSATAAAASAANAAASYDQFDDRYLGSKTADPTLDNDGNALVSGALYFNSTANEMRVYDGANWIPSSSAGTASLVIYEYTATSGQTTFSGTDDNSATLSYSVNNLQVSLNGVLLDSGDYTATSGTSIVLGSGAATGDLLTVYAFKSFTVAELNANNLTDGTIPDARFPATLPAISGANLTNLDASDLASGTIPDARFPAVLPAVDGSNLTGITSVGGATGVDFNDNVKARFGTGNDLEIYHDGNNSYIHDNGTGNLIVRADQFDVKTADSTAYKIRGITGGAVSLYHNGNSKLATTSTGVDVTGTVTATSFSGDGSALTGITTGISWQSTPKTASFTASANEGYYVNTTSNSVTMTLPSSPSVNDEVGVIDFAGTFDTNKLVIARNSLKIIGTSSDKQVVTERAGIVLIYTGTTQGWVVKTSNSTSNILEGLSYNIEYLVVAGGGGTNNDTDAGGGGAGGYRNSYASETSGRNSSTETPYTVSAGTTITVTVGGGGAQANGSNSSISGSGLTTITSTGGGVGVGQRTAGSGGSGGGCADTGRGGVAGSGAANQGFGGGVGNTDLAAYTVGGGGGGASASGNNASGNTAGNGGNGLASSITGSSVTRAGGGGGGGNGSSNRGLGGSGGGGNGQVNSGGNGGAANTGGGAGGYGAVGGSGVVILRFPTASYSGTTTGSPTVSTSGSDTILTFTGSGSYTT